MDPVLSAVRSAGLLVPDEPVVVLVSGGQDSTCLLGVAVALGCRTRALHVNHGLRPEAGEDELHVRTLCAGLGVEVVVEHLDRPDGAPGNLQAWARDARYAAGARLVGEHGGVLATGHTATDQAETVLYRLAASPGRRALLGMPVRSGRLVRPLLAVTREQTAGWCLEHGLAWREDATNDSDRFARSRVRNGLVPALRAVDERAEANVVRTAALLRDEAEVLDVVVDTALAGGDSISVGHLGALPRALARLVVRRLAEAATGGLCGRAPGRLDELLVLEDGALDVGDGARAVVCGGVLSFEPTPPLPEHLRR